MKMWERPFDDRVEKETVLGNERKVLLDIRRWNNLLIGYCSCPSGNRADMLSGLAKYLPKNKSAQDQLHPVLTIAQAQRAIKLLFRTFDLSAFLPLKSKKGISMTHRAKTVRYNYNRLLFLSIILLKVFYNNSFVISI